MARTLQSFHLGIAIVVMFLPFLLGWCFVFVCFLVVLVFRFFFGVFWVLFVCGSVVMMASP